MLFNNDKVKLVKTKFFFLKIKKNRPLMKNQNFPFTLQRLHRCYCNLQAEHEPLHYNDVQVIAFSRTYRSTPYDIHFMNKMYLARALFITTLCVSFQNCIFINYSFSLGLFPFTEVTHCPATLSPENYVFMQQNYNCDYIL